jgi:hypothetical protein
LASSATSRERDDDTDAEADGEPEKIEVHVHVHRDDRGAGSQVAAPRKRRSRSPTLTGALFDWKQHYDQVCKPSPAGGRSPARARRATKVAIALGVGAVIGVFGLCSALLSEAPPEHSPHATQQPR